ncbi:hypothetical protein OnM2_030025 [Erysiphe neolycopersici]|uniref:Uncharacterized protein n=1 Tax=Erysiphe neolycopersici TaxID=212602 RepID=A0A420HZ92_9PEZI|nr:hypothetical protein OnM2_030025 [Erysiphe neolycopersici]
MEPLRRCHDRDVINNRNLPLASIEVVGLGNIVSHGLRGTNQV